MSKYKFQFIVIACIQPGNAFIRHYILLNNSNVLFSERNMATVKRKRLYMLCHYIVSFFEISATLKDREEKIQSFTIFFLILLRAAYIQLKNCHQETN